MQKNSTLKLLLALFVIATLVLSYLILSKNKVCGNFISTRYEVIYPGGSENCNYIILKNKNEKQLGWLTNKDAKKKDAVYLRAKPIDTASAARFIMRYNEKHNPELKNTSFIDMDRKEMLLYLIDVASVAKADKDNLFRIYLADRSENDSSSEISAIVTAKTDQGEIFLKDPILVPLDWGSLCPPPYDVCINEKKALLLQRAVWSSAKLTFATSTVQKP